MGSVHTLHIVAFILRGCLEPVDLSPKVTVLLRL